jgi:hypothetical protein
MRTLFVAALFAGAVASLSGADAAGGCGAGFHRGPNGGCIANGSPVVVVPGAPVVAAPRVCPPGSIWRAGACRPI